jgi:hypothetical protein
VVKRLISTLAAGDVEHEVEDERGQDVAEQTVGQVGDAVGPRGGVLGSGNGLTSSSVGRRGTEAIRFGKEASNSLLVEDGGFGLFQTGSQKARRMSAMGLASRTTS